MAGAGNAHREEAGTVVRTSTADDFRPLLLPLQPVILLGNLDRGLYRLGAARGKKRAVQVTGCDVFKLFRKANGGLGGKVVRRNIGQLGGLFGHRLRHFTAAVTNVGHKGAARQRVNILLTVDIGEIAALAFSKDGHPALGAQCRRSRDVEPDAIQSLLFERKFVSHAYLHSLNAAARFAPLRHALPITALLVHNMDRGQTLRLGTHA